MTALRTAGLITVMVMLWVVVGWSQEGNSPVEDQRSLPMLELSDVVVVGVEQAGHPQGKRHRELPGVPPAIILSTIANTREFSRTAIGTRHTPGMIPIGTTRFLTAWIGGANHYSADAFVKLNAKGEKIQGVLVFDWLSQSGAIDYIDRNQRTSRFSGSWKPSRYFELGVQGLFERRRWRNFGSVSPADKRWITYSEGDILAEWKISPKILMNIRTNGANWIAEDDRTDYKTTLNRANGLVELHGQGKSFRYLTGIDVGWNELKRDEYFHDVTLARSKVGITFPLQSRIAAGAIITGAYWKDRDNENNFHMLPEGFVSFNLSPLFGLRVQGGSSVSVEDVVENQRTNPYLKASPTAWVVYKLSPWVQEKPVWVQAEINRSFGNRVRVRGWGGWEKIEGYPTFIDFHYVGIYSVDQDTVEITKAGLGCWWQPIDPIEIDIYGERIWGKIDPTEYWVGCYCPPIPHSDGVPFLENGTAQIKITVKPNPAWTFALSGHLHGERPNWDESGDLPSYGAIGAEVRWKTPTPFWLALWGENITDTHYETFPGYEGEPFRIGIRLGFMTSPY